jgi:hypothetical protein
VRTVFSAGDQLHFCFRCFTETGWYHKLVDSVCERCGENVLRLPKSSLMVTAVDRERGIITVRPLERN